MSLKKKIMCNGLDIKSNDELLIRIHDNQLLKIIENMSWNG